MLRLFARLVISILIMAVIDAIGLKGSGRSTQTRVPEGTFPPEFTPLLLAWIVLLLLGGVEFAASFLPLGRSLRPLIMLPGVLMVAVVAIGFMEIGKGPAIVRGFAIAAMFWLIVLLGLGSVDPLTRSDYLVPHAHVD